MRTTILTAALVGGATAVANAQGAGEQMTPPAAGDNSGQTTGALPQSRETGGPSAKTLRGHQDRQAMNGQQKKSGKRMQHANPQAQPDAGGAGGEPMQGGGAGGSSGSGAQPGGMAR